jgi:hypothetical protein
VAPAAAVGGTEIFHPPAPETAKLRREFAFQVPVGEDGEGFDGFRRGAQVVDMPVPLFAGLSQMAVYSPHNSPQVHTPQPAYTGSAPGRHRVPPGGRGRGKIADRAGCGGNNSRRARTDRGIRGVTPCRVFGITPCGRDFGRGVAVDKQEGVPEAPAGAKGSEEAGGRGSRDKPRNTQTHTCGNPPRQLLPPEKGDARTCARDIARPGEYVTRRAPRRCYRMETE